MVSTEIAAPPFHLDVRVAKSPIVGLRYALDGRATEIDEVVDRLTAAAAEAAAAREDIRARLRPHETSRRAILERLARGNTGDLLQRLDEGLALRTELATVEERMTCLRERIDALREQRSTLRKLSAQLVAVDHLHDASIDGAGAAENQAVRQLFHLVDVDHRATVQDIFEGPMQLLADAALHTELLGRAVRSDDAAAANAGVASCRASTDAALRELNNVVFQLHPDDLREHGLVPSIRRLAGDLSAGGDARVLVLGKPRRLRSAVETAVFRIVQEGVLNAREHGHADSIEVVLLFQPQRLVAVVRDDGEGFDVAATEARLGRSTGLGLITMRQRAVIENAHLDVRSVVGEGTEVRASFPNPD
jgi:two-component system sensor histidine kinase DegS